ncbi:hypothetical protein DBT_1576 [Dissulfuribacter thermophilus]|uniref:Uncharacterized protein n=2 Tax=Dissulfuribacter thermophilus TaxID=1156395 RepID=A0A1B9F5A4_9BACT|nr:hypothetical protein DBT_1576 [Dissulfuribacter thermophilus]
MQRIPTPSLKTIVIESVCVILFCVSFFFFLYYSNDNNSLKKAISDLRLKDSELYRLNRSLEDYSAIKAWLLPCNQFKTPMLWEEVDISFDSLKFSELIHHLNFLNRDIKKVYHKDGIFLLEHMKMNGVSEDFRTTDQGTDNRASGPKTVFEIKGYLLSTCGDN